MNQKKLLLKVKMSPYSRDCPSCIKTKHGQAAGRILTTYLRNKFRLVNLLVISEEPSASSQNAEAAQCWKGFQVLREVVSHRGKRRRP